MDIDTRHDTERSRYELIIDGRVVGVADYRLAGDTATFHHTEIEPSMRRQGLAAQLVRAALDDVRDSGRTVVATCWYVAQFIDEHSASRAHDRTHPDDA